MSAAARVLTVAPDLSKYELRCRECHKSWGNQPKSICDDCFSPLEIFYDYDALRGKFTHERIASRAPDMWRYAELLPLPHELSGNVAGWLYASASRAQAGRASWRQTSLHQE